MFESTPHVGEDAELYALGELDETQRQRVERHVRSCGECARRVGDAESAVLRLVEDQAAALPNAPLPAFRARRAYTPQWIAAVAAAFALGLLPWLLTAHRSAAPQETGQLAMTAMLNGHFLHAPFAGGPAGAPNAKAIYARDGAWVYVLVAPATGALDVVAVSNGKRSTIGSIPAGSETRGAFFAQTSRPEKVELVENGATIASAPLVYPASSRR